MGHPRPVTARIPLPDGWADRPFRVGDALDAGVGRSRLGNSDLDRPFWGIRTSSPPVKGGSTRSHGPVGQFVPVRRFELEELCRALLVRMKDEVRDLHAEGIDSGIYDD